jgi:fatty acid desaturase
MEQPNKVEMSLIKWFVARFKSKSPAEYATLVKVCTVLAVLMGAYIGIYAQSAIIPHTGIWATLNGVFITAGAVLTATGITAASTTTDPTLTTRKPSDVSDRGNDNN